MSLLQWVLKTLPDCHKSADTFGIPGERVLNVPKTLDQILEEAFGDNNKVVPMTMVLVQEQS